MVWRALFDPLIMDNIALVPKNSARGIWGEFPLLKCLKIKKIIWKFLAQILNFSHMRRLPAPQANIFIKIL